MVEFRGLGKKLGVMNTAAWHRHLGTLDLRMPMQIYDKKSNARQSFKTLTAIAIAGYHDLKAELGDDFRAQFELATCPWADVAIAAADDTNKKAKPSGARELIQTGEITLDVLQNLSLIHI